MHRTSENYQRWLCAPVVDPGIWLLWSIERAVNKSYQPFQVRLRYYFHDFLSPKIKDIRHNQLSPDTEMQLKIIVGH